MKRYRFTCDDPIVESVGTFHGLHAARKRAREIFADYPGAVVTIHENVGPVHALAWRFLVAFEMPNRRKMQ